MWLANALTVSRVPLAIAFYLSYPDVAWSLAIVAGAALSDALDGTIARWARARGSTSTVGEWLDPIADKIFVIGVLGTVVVAADASWPLVLAIGARELVIIPVGLVYRVVLSQRPRVEHAFKADALGKATTVGQFVAVAALVGKVSWAPVIALITGMLGLAAVAHYIVRGVATEAR